MNGTFHEWLEERRPGGYTMNLISDATSAEELQLDESETIWLTGNTTLAWIEKCAVSQV